MLNDNQVGVPPKLGTSNGGFTGLAINVSFRGNVSFGGVCGLSNSGLGPRSTSLFILSSPGSFGDPTM